MDEYLLVKKDVLICCLTFRLESAMSTLRRNLRKLGCCCVRCEKNGKIGMKYSIVNIVECGKSVGKGYFLSALRVKMYGIDVMRLDVLDSYES